jgi:hypothetical protein
MVLGKARLRNYHMCMKKRDIGAMVIAAKWAVRETCRPRANRIAQRAFEFPCREWLPAGLTGA